MLRTVRRTLLACLAALPAWAATTTHTLPQGGITRTYHVTVADSHDGSALPLVLDLHGFASNASQQMAISGFSGLAAQGEFIAVHPEGWGTPQSWNAYACCGAAQSSDLDDVQLMRDIVADVAAAWNVDLSRVYATGLSNGSSMAHRLGCEASDLFAGIAGVSFPLASPAGACQPEHPITVLSYHGTFDTVIPYWGGSLNPAAPVAINRWRQQNACASFSYTSLFWGNTVCRTYPYCDDNVNTSLCTVYGGVHVLYFPSASISISAHAWDILQDHQR